MARSKPALRSAFPLTYLLAGVGLLFVAELCFHAATAEIGSVDLLAEARLAYAPFFALALAVGSALSLVTIALALAGRPQKTRVPKLAYPFAAIALLASAVTIAWPLRSGPSARPDVLLIVVDTLRVDFVRPERTPEIERLRRSGITFTNAYSTAPWTLPSFGTMFTGRPPREHRAGFVGGRGSARGRLRSDIATLAELLSDAGYQTVALTTNPHLRVENGLDRGFESYRNLVPAEALFAATFASSPRSRAASASMQTTRALTWLGLRDSHRPLFLLVHYMDPHRPWTPRASFLREETELGTPPGEPARYGAVVREADRGIGVLVGALERAGRLDDTLVVVTSDHGEGLEAGTEREGHGNTLFPELTRALLAFRLPGAKAAGTRCAGVASLVDLAPTIAKLVGLRRSLGSGRAILDRSGRCLPGEGTAFFGATERGPIREGLATSEIGLIWTRPDVFEAFDLASDPDYRSPVTPAPAAWVRALRDRVRSEEARAKEEEIPAPVELSPEVREQLEGLGYLE